MISDLLDSDRGPLSADNSGLNVLFIHSSIDDMELSPHAFRVLCHLKRRADQTGKAFPGMRRMAEKCCMSIGSVCQSVKELQLRGVLKVQARGENVSNAYFLTSPKDWLKTDKTPFYHPNLPQPEEEGCCSPVEQGVHILNGGVHRLNSGCSHIERKDIQGRESKEGYPLKGEGEPRSLKENERKHPEDRPDLFGSCKARPGSVEEVISFMGNDEDCIEHHVDPVRDGKSFWYDMQACDWKDSRGKVKDWRAKVKKYAIGHILPSQKQSERAAEVEARKTAPRVVQHEHTYVKRQANNDSGIPF